MMKPAKYARYMQIARKREAEESRKFRHRLMVETFRILGRKMQERRESGMYDVAALNA